MSLTLLTATGGMYFLAQTWAKSPAQAAVNRYSTLVTISEQDEICQQLLKKKLVDNNFLCKFYKNVIQKSKPISGNYQISSKMSPAEIFTYLSKSENQVTQLKRLDSAQKWYVDILGPSQDYDLATKIKNELRSSVFNKEWEIQENGTDIVEVTPTTTGKVSVIFLEENSDKRIESFQNSTDKVYLYRVWIKRLDNNVNVTFSAFEPPENCVGPDLAKDLDVCRNWQRTIRPGVFNFPEDKLVKAVVSKLKATPFN